MFNKSDNSRNEYMLKGKLAKNGYDWWWHSFTGINAKTGEEKPFFIEFFALNPKYGKKYPVFSDETDNSEKRKGKNKPSYIMIKAGCHGENAVQLHRFYGVKRVIFKEGNPFEIYAGECFLNENETRGKIRVSKKDSEEHPEKMSDAGEMIWNLSIKKEIAYNVGYGASKLFRDINAFEMYWHAQGMKTKYEGYVIFNGERFDVLPDKSYGYADKNWGSDFTSPWVWLSSNNLYSKTSGKKLENSAFDIGGGKPRVFGIPLDRKLLGGFFYEGRELEYNFSKFWTNARQRFASEETEDEIRWKVWLENRKTLMKIEVRCKKKDMLLVKYQSPDGMRRHDRLFNGGNGRGLIQIFEKNSYGLLLLDEIEARNVGCEYGEYNKIYQKKAKKHKKQ